MAEPTVVPGAGLLQSLGSVKLIAQRPCFVRPDDPEGVLHGTAYITHPGGLIGRARHADARIDRPYISREHCVVVPWGIDWAAISRSSTTGVKIIASNHETLSLPRGFPWILVDGLQLVFGKIVLVVDIDRPDRVAGTTTLATYAEEVLPQGLFETALALTAPYRAAPPSHTFTPVRELVATLRGVTTKEGVYRRLNRLEEWPAIASELSNRRLLAEANNRSALAGTGDRYAELAAAIVVAYPGFGVGK